MITGKKHTDPYTWGASCKAWVLQQSGNMIIKEEMMPPGTCETLHFHEKTEQFFYILEGVALFSIEVADGARKSYSVQSGEGTGIRPGKAHRIENAAGTDLRFLVISAPGYPKDRIELEE